MQQKLKVAIKEGEIETALGVYLGMHEFSGFHRKEEIEDQLKNRQSLILTAYKNEMAVGFLIGYDKYLDGSFYCWMLGVAPEFRRRGVLTQIMDYLSTWALKNNYEKITLKTRNNRREMLAYLVKSGFNIKNVEINPAIEEHKILFEKKLI
ncbi:MAG: GNAT family N-acetyltransferase [Candidatus Moraniibacteriota bacterium]